MKRPSLSGVNGHIGIKAADVKRQFQPELPAVLLRGKATNCLAEDGALLRYRIGVR
jgi:hypothetical protein